MENENGKKLSFRQLSIIAVGIAIVMIVAVIVIIVVKQSQNQDTQPQYERMVIDSWTSFNYSISADGMYTIIADNGDGMLQLPEINMYVSTIRVNFAQPIPQPMNISVYYASESHGYSESYRVGLNFEEGESYAIIPLGEEITTCRVDVGIHKGDSFYIENIIINDDIEDIVVG